MSLEDVLRFVNVLASGLAAGIPLTFVVGIVPALRGLSDATALAFKQSIDPLVDRFSPPAVVLSILTAVLLLIFADDLSTSAEVFLGAGLGCSLGVAAISLGIHVPINRTMSGWSPESPPPEFSETMARWARVHALRTVFGLGAFACYLGAVLAA